MVQSPFFKAGSLQCSMLCRGTLVWLLSVLCSPTGLLRKLLALELKNPIAVPDGRKKPWWGDIPWHCWLSIFHCCAKWCGRGEGKRPSDSLHILLPLKWRPLWRVKVYFSSFLLSSEAGLQLPKKNCQRCLDTRQSWKDWECLGQAPPLQNCKAGWPCLWRGGAMSQESGLLGPQDQGTLTLYHWVTAALIHSLSTTGSLVSLILLKPIYY